MNQLPDKFAPKARTKSVLLVLCAVPDRAIADSIATNLVEMRLAACVSIIPGISSVYRWKGAVEQSSELLLLIKCSKANFKGIVKYIQSVHPYELPEIIGFKVVVGNLEYIDWVLQESA